MIAPSQNASTDVYVDFNTYCTAALLADPETREVAPLLESAGEKLEKAAGGREEARRKVIRATARRDFSFRLFVTALGTFERKARSEFPQGPKDPRYAEIFTATPAQFARVAIEARESELEPLVGRITDPELPKELEKPGKAVAAAWRTYQGHVKELVAAQGGFDKARAKEQQAKADNLSAIHKTEGRLTDRFPDDRLRVRSYFPPPKDTVSDEKRIERAAKKARRAEEKVQKAQAAAALAAEKAQKAAEKAAAKARAAAERAAKVARIEVPTPGPVASGTAAKSGAPAVVQLPAEEGARPQAEA